jgi:hypothetical protein
MKERIELKKLGKWYYGRHSSYGDLLGYIESGVFIAHQRGPGGSFFKNKVWVNDGFEIVNYTIKPGVKDNGDGTASFTGTLIGMGF